MYIIVGTRQMGEIKDYFTTKYTDVRIVLSGRKLCTLEITGDVSTVTEYVKCLAYNNDINVEIDLSELYGIVLRIH